MPHVGSIREDPWRHEMSEVRSAFRIVPMTGMYGRGLRALEGGLARRPDASTDGSGSLSVRAAISRSSTARSLVQCPPVWKARFSTLTAMPNRFKTASTTHQTMRVQGWRSS